MKETGLTKKAIYFYEEAGLLSPKKEADSNYRIYTADDVKTLTVIHFLRQLDFSIKDIQLMLSEKQNAAEIITRQLDLITEKIKLLNENKEVLEDLIAGSPLRNSDMMMESIRSLNGKSKKMAGYMQKELNRILPGNLGKMFAIYYGQFLDEPLDSAEKEDAWRNLINLLDAQEEFEYDADMKALIDEMFGKYSDNELIGLSEKSRNVTDQILKQPRSVSDAEKDEIRLKLAEYQKTPQYQKDLKFQQFVADNLVPIFKEVDSYLCILSTRFEEVNKILKAGSCEHH